MCPGGDLKAHVSRWGRFPPEVAAFCCAQVLLALEYLHERHVIHRDIKLENILLDGEGYVRVTDFNVAKLIEERRTFSMKGTLFCMAPEVILKKGHDASADFWSFGVLIYELLTGGPPFYSPDKQELKRQILGMDPRRFNPSFPPDMPTACRMLLSQLLVREPRLRLGARKQDVAIMKAHPFSDASIGRGCSGASYLRRSNSPSKPLCSRGRAGRSDTRSARLTENLRRHTSRVRALRSCTIGTTWLQALDPTGSLRLLVQGMQRAHPMQE